MNKYFILLLNDTNITEILTFTVDKIETLRKSVDGTKGVVKLPVNSEVPGILQDNTPYSHSEILEIMSTPEWTHPM